eukprot:2455855-Amphidinium_carterae.1
MDIRISTMRTREESDSKSQKPEKDFKCKLAQIKKLCKHAQQQQRKQHFQKRCSSNLSDKTSPQRSLELGRK